MSREAKIDTKITVVFRASNTTYLFKVYIQVLLLPVRLIKDYTTAKNS